MKGTKMAAPAERRDEEEVARRKRQRHDNVVQLPVAKAVAKASADPATGKVHAERPGADDWIARVRTALSAYQSVATFVAPMATRDTRLDAVEREVQRLKDLVGWHRYLVRLEQRATPHQASVIRQLWCRVEDLVSRDAPLPMATREGESISIAWSRLGWYLGFEVLPDGTVEWFFRDRQSGAAEGTPAEPEPHLPERFFELLVTYAR